MRKELGQGTRKRSYQQQASKGHTLVGGLVDHKTRTGMLTSFEYGSYCNLPLCKNSELVIL